MVEISLRGDLLQIDVLGWSRLWSLKSRLDVPPQHVRRIRRDGQLPQGFWLRWPGTSIPGIIKAGSFWNGRRSSLWDVRRRPDKVVVIELSGWKYDYVVVEVENPALTVEQVRAAIEHAKAV
jgi:hypothetical protein